LEIGEFSKQFPQFRTVVSIMEISAFLPCQRPPLILIHPFPLVQGDQKSLDICAQYDVIDDDCHFLNHFNGRIQCKCRRKCPNPVRIIIPVIPIYMRFPILPRRPPLLGELQLFCVVKGTLCEPNSKASLFFTRPTFTMRADYDRVRDIFV